jgi:hypothetical protein
MTYKNLDNGKKKSFRIYNVETKSVIGHVKPEGTIWIVEDGENRRIAVVNSLQEAGPALAAHYDKHSRWVRDGENYFKWTKFGELEVFPLEGRGWAAWRNGERHLMLHDDIAIFASAEEARNAADAHVGDSVAASNQTADALSWFVFDFDVTPAPHDRPNEAQARA